MTESITSASDLASRLPGSVQSAPAGQKGFDSDTVITSVLAPELARLGYKFAIRYVSLGTTEEPGDLTYGEALAILNAGLALMVVQHVPQTPFSPSAALGTQYGQEAADHAAAIGLPAKVNVWLDLEGVAEGTAPQAVIDYCNNWSSAVSAKGFTPGVYVGANSGLNSTQLGGLKFTHFWKSASTVPPIPGRGYQLIQGATIDVLGISIDIDTTQNDEKKGAVQWLRK